LAAIASQNEGKEAAIALVKQDDRSLVLVTNAARIVVSAPAASILSSSILEKIFVWLRGK
jgi:hypothetical protein